MQRDTAIVVSPRKVLSLTLYEVNPYVVEATAGAAGQQHSTLEDFTDHDQDGYDPFNLPYVRNTLGFNTLWLMPIFPNTRERLDPDQGRRVENYSPGSPYAARDYWSVSERLSDAGTPEASLREFRYLVGKAEELDLNVFIDVALNHAGRDVIFGQGAADLGSFHKTRRGSRLPVPARHGARANPITVPTQAMKGILLNTRLLIVWVSTSGMTRELTGTLAIILL